MNPLGAIPQMQKIVSAVENFLAGAGWAWV